jgi:hypothetical protein
VGRLRQRGLTVPRLTGQEMADITGYLYTAYYFESAAGRAERGRELVQKRGCPACHPIHRKGANIASDLTIDSIVSTPAGQAAAMRNHGRYMATKARRQSTTPTPLLPPRPDRYAATVRADTGPPVEGSCDG